MTREEKRARAAAIRGEVAAGAARTELAKKYNLSYARVSDYCRGLPKRGRPDTITNDAGQPLKSMWDLVNWDCQDVLIAQVLGVSRQRARQVRRERGENDPKNKWMDSTFALFDIWIKDHKSELDTLTAAEIITLSGVSIGVHNAYKILNENNILYRVSGGKNQKVIVPWNDVDWRIDDVALTKIWRTETGRPTNYHTFCQRRSDGDFPSATLRDGPEFDAAVLAEHEKARDWFVRGRFDAAKT